MSGSPAAGVIRVVLIEDDLRVARVNRDLLERDPDVHVVGTGVTCAEGDRLVRELRPDLVLLDVYLPDGSGLDLLRAWRAGGQFVDVVMVTAADDVTAVQHAVAHGALDYLVKPFDRARLAEAVGRYRTRRRPERQTLGQQDIDRYLGVTTTAALPKGVDAHTLQHVEGALQAAAGPLGAEEVGAQCGLSRVTAWRYLEYLTAAGRAEIAYQYGAAGRPAKMYRALSARDDEQT